jgi:trimethylamine--corrinoid protein Co-methyltransferase
VVVDTHRRLSEKQIDLVDEASREILQDPGLFCYNEQAAQIFRKAGAELEQEDDCVRLRVPPRLIDDVLETAPSTVTLGARDPDNRLILDADEPRVRFGTGSETNIWLEVDFQDGRPTFTRREGSTERLTLAAHLCENLENLDFFIRCVNIRDEEVTRRNKDVNKLLASLNNITKHVQAGLTGLSALDECVRMGRIIAGGEQAFRDNPVLSFITCVIKSPLQVVQDTATKLIEISRRQVPVVISSSPMGGATAPFDEFGMVAQINAEILAGVALNQLAGPGAPVLYGSVPVRTSLDNLDDMYAAPKFNHYHIGCAQMARHYGLRCYSTAGVADAEKPRIQATAEKMLTHCSVPGSGAQYVHYAFGLLERTNVFCPEQAVLDDAHIGIVKFMFQEPNVSEQDKREVLKQIRQVMQTDHKTYIYNLPLPTREPVYAKYPLEDEEGDALLAAHRRYHEILDEPHSRLPEETRREIESKVDGVLPQTLQ